MNGPPIITKSRLTADLRALGVAEGQTMMVHASVKAVGWIVGGPHVILHSILDILRPSGTLMMLASWEDNPYHLRDWPQEKRDAYLAECPAFDQNRSRADHREMSILAEYLRTWPGAVRSRHPFSFVAVGRRAKWLTKDHPLQYNNGPCSPLAKLCEAGGSVLLLGPLFQNLTILHHAEHLANVPNKRIDRYRLPVLRNGQRVWMDFEEYDTTNGIVDWPDDYFVAIAKEYLAAGNGRKGAVGAAESCLFDAASVVRFGVRWMEDHFAPKHSLSSERECKR